MNCKIIIASASLLLLAGCISAPQKVYAPTDAVNIPAPKGAAADVEQAVREQLKDPSSAQFGPTSFFKDTTGEMFACGSVNAKNSYGGYVGSTPFYASVSLINGVYTAGIIMQRPGNAGLYTFQALFPKCAE
jgi:hypothetical protein